MAETFLQKKHRQLIKGDWRDGESVSTASPLGAPVDKDSPRSYKRGTNGYQRATRGNLLIFAALAGLVFLMITFVGPAYLAAGDVSWFVVIVLFALWVFCGYKFLQLTSFYRWTRRQKH